LLVIQKMYRPSANSNSFSNLTVFIKNINAFKASTGSASKTSNFMHVLSNVSSSKTGYFENFDGSSGTFGRALRRTDDEDLTEGLDSGVEDIADDTAVE